MDFLYGFLSAIIFIPLLVYILYKIFSCYEYEKEETNKVCEYCGGNLDYQEYWSKDRQEDFVYLPDGSITVKSDTFFHRDNCPLMKCVCLHK